MTITEHDMLETAEYVIELLDRAKAKPDRFTEVPNGCGQYDSEHGDWMDRAKKIVAHRKSKYIDNRPKSSFGPGGDGI